MIRNGWWTCATAALACAVGLSACGGDDVPALSQTTDLGGMGGGAGGGAGGGGGEGATDGGGTDGGCTPAAETCNGLDEDCDGQIDESAAEVGTPCGTDVGACVPGVTVCRGGATACIDAVGPARGESCNGIDDDCDGAVDEDAPDVGTECNACGGRFQCVDGAILCDAAGPAPETCNGLDDDCDGTTDEGLPGIGEPCGGVGACAPGVRTCTGGVETCEGAGMPGPELCNGRDDDCDGTTDEEAPRVGERCEAGATCGAGVFVCAGGQLGCRAEGAMGVPESCNGLDDDCDGLTDEADPQVGQNCGSDVGACEFGALTCIAGQILCLGGAPSVPETCDRLDNDCDGLTDEGDDTRGGIPCPGPGQACEIDRNCASDVCLNDSGTRYCSAVCNVVGGVGPAAGCPDDLRCESRNGRNICLKTFPRCLSDADCAGGAESCQLLPSPAPDVFGGQCRPRFADGLPNAAPCGPEVADRCASGLCIAGPDTCGSLCRTAQECPASQACALTPFVLGNGQRLELGLCLNACTNDGQCADDGSVLCQYNRRADRAAVVGYCDLPYPGAGVGAPCDYLADPPLTCAHGFCNFSGGAGYCTNGCVTDFDCQAGWRCRERPYGNEGLTIGWCER